MSTETIPTVKKYCPDCKSNLQSLSIVSSHDFPNQYRTMIYRCWWCSRENKITKLFFFRKTKLKKLKSIGKFKAFRIFALKLNMTIKNLSGYQPVVTKIPRKQFCFHCKEKLNYDSQASMTRNQNGIEMRSYYHFDCMKQDDDEIMFTFVRIRTDGLELIRMVQG